MISSNQEIKTSIQKDPTKITVDADDSTIVKKHRGPALVVGDCK